MEKETIIGRQILSDYDALITHLSEITGMLFHTDDVYRRYTESIKNEKIRKDIIFLGSILSFYAFVGMSPSLVLSLPTIGLGKLNK